jgi:hypothetical protein
MKQGNITVNFAELFQEALGQEDKFTALRQKIVALRENGYDKEVLLAELEDFRSQVAHEADKDVVLEVMDCLSGFCSPHMRID